MHIFFSRKVSFRPTFFCVFVRLPHSDYPLPLLFFAPIFLCFFFLPPVGVNTIPPRILHAYHALHIPSVFRPHIHPSSHLGAIPCTLITSIPYPSTPHHTHLSFPPSGVFETFLRFTSSALLNSFI